MKISTKTLNAARKAAKVQGMSLDAWAEQVLSKAAAAEQPSDIEAHLRKISRKIDLIADRQSLGERANEQLAGAVQEISASYRRVRYGAGQVLGQVETKTNSAAEEMTARARELIGRARKMTTELVGSLATRAEREAEAADGTDNARPLKTRSRSRTKEDAGKPATTGGRQLAAKRKTKLKNTHGSKTSRAHTSGPSRQR